mgnify:CR=1 FL=1
MSDLGTDFRGPEVGEGSEAGGEADPFADEVGKTADELEGETEGPANELEEREPGDKILEVNGKRAPLEEYAGGNYPPENLSPEAQKLAPEGVPIKENGCPDFSQWAEAEVEIDMKGDHYHDYKAANRAAGFEGAGARSPKEGYSWHHSEDGKTMQLVPRDLHGDVKHIGGAAVARAKTAAQTVGGA